MNVDWQVVRGYAFVAIAVAMGIAGTGMVFSGAMDDSLREISRGVPLLLIGLWWSGRELGRSMRANRPPREGGSPVQDTRLEKEQAHGRH